MLRCGWNYSRDGSPLAGQYRGQAPDPWQCLRATVLLKTAGTPTCFRANQITAKANQPVAVLYVVLCR